MDVVFVIIFDLFTPFYLTKFDGIFFRLSDFISSLHIRWSMLVGFQGLFKVNALLFSFNICGFLSLVHSCTWGWSHFYSFDVLSQLPICLPTRKSNSSKILSNSWLLMRTSNSFCKLWPVLQATYIYGARLVPVLGNDLTFRFQESSSYLRFLPNVWLWLTFLSSYWEYLQINY